MYCTVCEVCTVQYWATPGPWGAKPDCLLPMTYRLSPIAYRLLPNATGWTHAMYYCLLPTAYCMVPIAYSPLPIAYSLLPIACCQQGFQLAFHGFPSLYPVGFQVAIPWFPSRSPGFQVWVSKSEPGFQV